MYLPYLRSILYEYPLYNRIPCIHICTCIGHVAKSFALRSNPALTKGKQDLIGQIVNGAYATLEDQRAVKAVQRQEKYSLGGGGGGAGSGGAIKKAKTSHTNSNLSNDDGSSSKSYTDTNPNNSNKIKNNTSMDGGADATQQNDKRKQKIRILNKRHEGGHNYDGNGKVKKLSIRKQMTSNMNSEFSAV